MGRSSRGRGRLVLSHQHPTTFSLILLANQAHHEPAAEEWASS
jgi:hypothetical protein